MGLFDTTQRLARRISEVRLAILFSTRTGMHRRAIHSWINWRIGAEDVLYLLITRSVSIAAIRDRYE